MLSEGGDAGKPGDAVGVYSLYFKKYNEMSRTMPVIHPLAIDHAVTAIPVHSCAIEAHAGAQGLRLLLNDGASSYRIDLPDFVVLQLLRTVSQREATQLPMGMVGIEHGMKVAPVQEWRVAQLDEQGTAAIQLTDVRGIAGVYAFDLEELEALYLVIGDLMQRVRPSAASTTFN